MKLGDLFIGKRLFIGCGKPKALGTGPNEIRGSAYDEDPVQNGTDSEYSDVEATLMVGHEYNSDSDTHPDKAIKAKGNVEIIGNTNQIGNTTQEGTITATGTITSNTQVTARGHNLTAKKNFDMPHPTKEGWRLRHVCLEGPEAAVYCRGRITNKNEIQLPSYWKGLVYEDSISVQLQSIGSHQNIIVKRWDENKVYLQSQGGMPVDCFYHIIAERKDGERLIVEYEGKTIDDYPGDNSEYSHNR